MRMRLTFGLVSLLAVCGPTQSALAQTAIPPSAGPCTVNGSTAICEGDLSAGVNVDGSVIDHLIVQNLTQNITPAFDVEAIDFRDGGAATGITLDVDLGRFGVSVDSEPAVYIEEDGIGDVVVNFFGDITATGPRGGGIFILETGRAVFPLRMREISPPIIRQEMRFMPLQKMVGMSPFNRSAI